MAFQLVHTFTSTAGITYYLNVDFVTGDVQTDHSPPDQIPESSVTEAELGVPINSTLAETCSGTTKKYCYAFDAYPFIAYNEIPNSPDCGYSPPVCTFEISTSLNGTTNGNNNGSITVGVTPAGVYQYSLDNSTWQTSPVFNFLYQGIYTIYVRNEAGCTKSVIVRLANLDLDTPVIPPDINYQQTNLICYFFKLVIDGVSYLIREPLKWDDINIVGERDPEFHGYLFKYSDGQVNLGFDCYSGRDLIEAVYNSKGQDGDIDFIYGFTYLDQEYTLFPGKLMLGTYKWYPEKIECAIETSDLDTAFTSRTEVKVSMTQDKSYDDEDVPVPAPYNLPLHAKQILTKILTNSSGKTYESFAYSTFVDKLYIKPDNTEPSLFEILDNYQYPLGDQTSNPVEVEEYIIDFKTAGTSTINVSLDMDVILTRLPFATSYTAKVILAFKKYNISTNVYDTVLTDITTTPVSGGFSGLPGSGTFNIQGTYSGTQNFLIADKVYCYILIETDHEGYFKVKLTQNNFTFNVEHLETSVSTPANAWFIEDVIRHITNVISSNRYAVRSSFFERAGSNQVYDGCGSKYVLTNGFQIRQFDIANRPLKLDLKKVLRSLNANFCIGMNYANDDNGAHIRLERADYYYEDREILSIEELQSYREEVASDIIYNELEIGYEKYQDNGYNSLDEFNTKTEWLTPIKKNKKKLSQLSAFIASGYAIETIRRDQFNEKPSSSVTNDEEPFIIAVQRTDAANWETEKDDAFETVTGIISPETSYNLRLSPKRMLYNWLIWLKGIFAYKDPADKIINTNILQNSELVTRFDEEEECRVGDEDRNTLAEKDPVLVSDMATTTEIYKPERVFVTCRLTPQQVQTINLAMTSRYDNTKDRGYIMVKKPTGTWQAMWIDKLSYNFATEKAEISGKKKFTSPAEPETGECCRWLVVNGCYLLINGERIVA